MTARPDMRERLAALLGGDQDRVPSNLTPTQSRLEFLQRLAPETARNSVAVRRVGGELDDAALQQAVASVVQRHESLRTRFVRIADQPLRIVVDAVEGVSVTVETVEDEGQLGRALAAETRRPFELERAPLLRVAAYRIDGTTVLVVVAHQLVADAPSMDVVATDLAAAYGQLRGEGEGMTGAARQYTDIAAEVQHDEVDERRREAWWRDHLDGVEPLEVPTDRPRPAVQPLDPVSAERALEANLASQEDASPFVLAAWAALLSRYARQRDVVLAVPVSERERTGAATAVGPLEDVVPLRVHCGDDPTFDDLVERVRVARAAARESRLPFAQILDALQPDRDMSRAPLAQTSVRVQAVDAGRAGGAEP